MVMIFRLSINAKHKFFGVADSGYDASPPSPPMRGGNKTLKVPLFIPLPSPFYPPPVPRRIGGSQMLLRFLLKGGNQRMLHLFLLNGGFRGQDPNQTIAHSYFNSATPVFQFYLQLLTITFHQRRKM